MLKANSLVFVRWSKMNEMYDMLYMLDRKVMLHYHLLSCLLSWCPGLDIQTEGCEARRDVQTRNPARQHWSVKMRQDISGRR